jgi:hypothetical protein
VHCPPLRISRPDAESPFNTASKPHAEIVTIDSQVTLKIKVGVEFRALSVRDLLDQ